MPVYATLYLSAFHGSPQRSIMVAMHHMGGDHRYHPHALSGLVPIADFHALCTVVSGVVYQSTQQLLNELHLARMIMLRKKYVQVSLITFTLPAT